MVITARTRNAVTEQSVQGFESLRFRQFGCLLGSRNKSAHENFASLFCCSFWLRSLFASSSCGRNNVALRCTTLTLLCAQTTLCVLCYAWDESLRFRQFGCLLGSRNKSAHENFASLFCCSFWLRSLFASSSCGRNNVALRCTTLTLLCAQTTLCVLCYAWDESLRFRQKEIKRTLRNRSSFCFLIRSILAAVLIPK